MGGGAMGLELRGFCFLWLFCASVRETAGRGRKKRKEKKRRKEKNMENFPNLEIFEK
jgi:hypothetical protein